MRQWILLIGLMGFVACTQGVENGVLDPSEPSPVTQSADPVQPPSDLPPADPITTQVVPEGEAPLVSEPIHETEPFVRPRRRMNIDQVDAAVRRATGGIGWDVGGKSRFAELAATLGKPDYRQVVQEDLSPTPVFQKFLGDAARFVCTNLVNKELESEPDNRVLIKYAAPDETEGPAIDENLQYLLLRYHGNDVTVDAPEMERWRWLFSSVIHLTQDPSQAWRAVCVALISHPEFFSY